MEDKTLMTAPKFENGDYVRILMPTGYAEENNTHGLVVLSRYDKNANQYVYLVRTEYRNSEVPENLIEKVDAGNGKPKQMTVYTVTEQDWTPLGWDTSFTIGATASKEEAIKMCGEYAVNHKRENVSVLVTVLEWSARNESHRVMAIDNRKDIL